MSCTKYFYIKVSKKKNNNLVKLDNYPLSIGRNFDELYRALLAMQTADAFEVACPADWRPGDDVIVPTAGSCGTAKSRMEDKENLDCKDWFFCTKKLDKDLVLKTILKD